MAFRRFYRRTFLNLRGHHAGAYVLADIDLETGFGGDSTERVVCGHLTLADCGRVTELQFDADDAAGARNALHKARELQRVVDGFVTALERAVDESGVMTRGRGRVSSRSVGR